MTTRIRDRRQSRESSRKYYWVTCVYLGQRRLIGCYNTEWEAQKAGAEEFPVDFEVVTLPTINRNSASSLLKGKLFEKYGLTPEVVKRLRHK